MFQKLLSSLSVFFLLAFCLLASCAHKNATSKRLPGVWAEKPIIVDGNGSDWLQPYPDYDSKAMIGYAVSNDRVNLYITVESGDPATQYKMIRGGLSVWIDKTGKKEMVMGINYPIPPDNSQVKSNGEQGESGIQRKKLDMTERVKLALSKADQFSLQGFKGCNEQYSIHERDSCGIEVRVAMDENNELVWEAKIPFKSFYPRAVLEARDKGKPLSVCFETTGLKRPPGQAQGGQRGGGGGGFRPSMGIGGGGMRFGGGGGRGGGGRGGGGAAPQNEQLYKSTTTWKKFGIAYKNVAVPAPPPANGN